MGHFDQGLAYELGLIAGNDQLHVRRETGFRVGQHFLDFCNRIEGIGIGGQGHRVGDGFAALAFVQEVGQRRVHTGAFIHFGNVLQFQDAAVACTDDDVAEFFRRLQTALGAGGVFELLVVLRRTGTDGADRRLDVLGLDGVLDIGNGDAFLGHQVRFQFHAHGVFRPVFINGRNAFDTFDGVDDVGRGIGLQEHGIIGAAR